MIKYFDGTTLSRIGFMELNKEGMKDNLPIYDDLAIELDRFLSAKNIERANATFVLNCYETRKITTVIPNVGDRKIKKIYDGELANKLPNIDQYDRLSMVSDSNNNKIWYEFIIEKRFKEYFEKLGKQLGFANVGVDNFYNYLYAYVRNIYKDKTLAYVYEEKGVASILTCIKGTLCSYTSFEVNEENYRLNMSAFVDNHINDLENVDIDRVVTNKDIECLQALNPSVRKYSIGG